MRRKNMQYLSQWTIKKSKRNSWDERNMQYLSQWTRGQSRDVIPTINILAEENHKIEAVCNVSKQTKLQERKEKVLENTLPKDWRR